MERKLEGEAKGFPERKKSRPNCLSLMEVLGGFSGTWMMENCKRIEGMIEKNYGVKEILKRMPELLG